MLGLAVDMGPDQLWMSHASPRESVFLEAREIGSFVRALLPVQLSGGYTVTYGVWVGVPSDELRRAFDVWFTPDYPDLVLDGLLANAVQPWGLLGAEVRTEVRDADATPYCCSSPSADLAGVLRTVWPHEEVLPYLPV